MRSVKMCSRLPKTNIPSWKLDSAVLILWAGLILLLPVRWIFAVLASMAFHELCHYVCIRLLGGRVFRISVGVRGVVMDTDPLTPAKELLAALAGPVGGLLLLLLAKPFPRLALCALFHSCWNLLPIYPMDGGRVLYSVFTLLLPGCCDTAFGWFQRTLLFFLIAICLWAALGCSLGAFPLLLAAFLLLKGKRQAAHFRFPGNNPCKAVSCAVK